MVGKLRFFLALCGLRSWFCATALLILFSTFPASAQRLPVEYYNGHKAVQSEILVKLKSPSPLVVSAIQLLIKADLVRQVGGPTGPYAFRAPNSAISDLVAVLSKSSEVEYVEPNYIYELEALPSDPYFFSLWGLYNTSQPHADIDAVSAWDVTTGSRQNVVAVLDTGIDYNHPDLSANMWRAPTAFSVNLSFGRITCPAGSTGYNALARSCDPMDFDGHGTHVAGTIGAVGGNSIGVTGVNWKTSIMALKIAEAAILDTVSVADAIDAIEFVIQTKNIFAGSANPANVRVISNSWGGFAFSQALLDAINKANSNNMLFVAAAGNLRGDNDATPLYPASYEAPNVVAVAASNSSDQLAGFSNYGRTSVDLAAPGDTVYSTWTAGGYLYDSGTSMATPHVSGTAALVLSVCNLSTSALKANLLSNVDLIPAFAGITVTGGRLNANKSVRACAPPTPLPTPNGGAVFVGVDTTTGGNWKGRYGSEGYSIASDATSYPSYAQVGRTNGLDYLWLASTADVRAPRKAASAEDRIASTWYSNGDTFVFDINITDNRSHQVGLYMLDWEPLSRVQKVEVLDAVNGAILDTRTVGEFRSGKYLLWNVSGHVHLRAVATGPISSSVASAIFFDPATSRIQIPTSATFVKADAVTQGSWQGQYGGDGYAIADGPALIPPYAAFTTLGAQPYTWERSTTDLRGLENPSGSDRMASSWYSLGTLFLDIDFTDFDSHQVGIYLLDWDFLSRSQRVEILDAFGNVLDSRDVPTFGTGQYLVWELQGHTQVRITPTGASNTVVSGIFFDTLGFSVTASPATQTITIGGGATFSLATIAEAGFTGLVNLSVSGLPAGATGSFSPATVTGQGASTLTISTSTATASGTYPLIIKGTHGSLIRSKPVTLVVNATRDFGISTTPSTRSVTAGSGTTYTVATTAIDGFSSAVALSVSGLPSGATATFSPAAITGAGTSALSISTASTTPAGNYSLTITGTSGALQHSSTVTLVVTAAGDFSVSATPSSRTVTAGTGTTYTATITPINGFTNSTSLSVIGLPTGATGSFSPSTISGGGSSTLSIATSSSTPAGTYTLTLRGTSGSLVRSATATLVINSNATFSQAVTPSSRTIVAGNNTSYTSTISTTSGFSGNVGFSVSGLPAGATASFSPSTRTGPGSSTLSVVTGNSTPAGTYTLTLRATSGSIVRTNNVTLVVTSSFNVSTNSSTSLARSSTVTVPVSITRLGGFSGAINLSAVNLPSGLTASFSPSTLYTSNSSNVTFRASSFTTRSTYTVTIRGTSGMTTRNTTISVTVR